MDIVPLALTAAVYLAATRLPRVPPVVTTALTVIVLLPHLGIAPEQYAAGTRPLVWLLGPAVVALAVPLVRERALLARSALPLLAAVTAGSLAALATTIALGRATGLAPGIIAALAPRAATAPVAAAVATAAGADPALAAAASVIGALALTLVAMPVLRAGGIVGGGSALGVAAHGIGVARTAALDPRAAAFASAAMTLNAVATALLAPLALLWR